MQKLGDDFRKFAKDFVSSSALHAIESKVLLPQLTNYYNVNDPKAMTHYVIEERPGNFRAIDVFTRLISDRIIFMGTQVDDQIANLIVAQLLFLNNADEKADITMYINSPGGSVYAGLAMIDTMDYIKPDVSTVCIGIAASMGAVLLAKGAKNKRFALPHSRVMIHQVLSGMQGQASDMEISLKQTLEVKKDLYNILAAQTGHPYEKIEKDCDRDYWMRAAEAVEYGMIDKVITR
jgi:ATP-dependent Clp protease protease subunit